jgi:CRP/FNR family cyclic AMP-dependent transcriptional regulator
VKDAPWPPSTLLGRLDEATRRGLMSLGIQRSMGSSHAILREGALESHVIVLDNALTKVTVSMADGRQALLAIRIIHRNEFRAFLHSHADAAMEIAGIVADRLRWANRRRVDFASYPVKVRLARVLWDIAAAYGHRGREGIVVDIQLTQAELATLCGAAEVSLQKALKDLRDAGIINTGYRQVIVRDASALRESAGID